MATLPETLQSALDLHKAGKLAEAEKIYRQILQIAPEYPDARHLLGACLARSSRLDEAVVHLGWAVKLVPDDAVYQCSLANALQSQGDYQAAIEGYRLALKLQPQYAEAHNNLGNALHRTGLLDEALNCYRLAILDRPDYQEALCNLAFTLAFHGRHEEAVPAFQQLLKLDPGNVSARYLLAAMTGQETPDRSPDEYLRSTFDRFAAIFDERLMSLGYRGPQLIMGSVRATYGQPRGALDIVDAGCGTGLCGPLVRPYARRLVGVDLSPGMIERARRHPAYDDLIVAELTSWFRGSSPTWDLIIAADTFIYFGDLQPVLKAAAGCLRSGGRILFTLEAGSSPDSYQLQPHGRYCHGQHYVERALESCGFTEIGLEKSFLRLERGQAVEGWTVKAAKV